MNLGREGIEVHRPADAELGRGEGLGAGWVLEPGKGVASANIAEVLSIEVAAEPLAPVDPDLNVEGQPALETHMHEAELWVQQVVVEEQALAAAAYQFEV